MHKRSSTRLLNKSYFFVNVKGWSPFSLVIVPSDLTELQVAVSDVNGRYEKLVEDLEERLNRQQASLELRQKAREDTEELRSWLSDREQSLKQGQTASPSRPEVVRAKAQENKVKSCVSLTHWLMTPQSSIICAIWKQHQNGCFSQFLLLFVVFLQALLSELAQHSGKVEELKNTLRKLLADNPDSPEADSWRQQLQEIGMGHVCYIMCQWFF